MKAAPVDAATLRQELLTAAELGPAYTVSSDGDDNSDDNGDDDVSAQGCEALQKLNDENPKMVADVDADFSYTDDSGDSSDLDEELQSDPPANLAALLAKVDKALSSCSSFTMTEGSSPVSVTVARVDLPQLGDQRVGFSMTIAGSGGTIVVEAVAIRKGSVLLNLSGAPGLVQHNLARAYAKLGSS